MKKNIIIVISAMNMGGSQRVVSILSNHWSKKGYSVSVISTNSGDKSIHFKFNQNIKLINLGNIPIFSSIKYLNYLWKLFLLRRAIKHTQSDIVISFLTSINIATTLATIGLKSNLIICERSWTPFISINKYFFWFFRILFKRIKKVIVQTNDSKIWINKNFPQINIEVIPNPIDYPLPTDLTKSVNPDSLIASHRKIILGSGRLHKYKQFDLLIKAFANIKNQHKEWDLVILGDGEERDNLNRTILDLGVNERVFLPGNVGNISKWYERADMFVLSSILEGFPNVLLESMSYGLPCISFDCNTGPREMIQNGINGILVNPQEKDSGIRNAMHKMITDNELRREFSNKSVKLREKFSVTNTMKMWDNILRA